MTEDQLNNLSDEELERLVADERANMQSPDTDIEESTPDVQEDSEEEIDSEDAVDDDDQEQPDDQDSDHDASTDELEEEGTDEDGEPDEGTDSEGTTAEGKEVQPVHQSYKFKANGREYEFSDTEIKEQFPKIFGQAMDYTKKMQAIKPWRKTIDAIEGAKLNHDDINLAIDVLKGDKNAIAEVLKRTGVDTLDLDTEESKYVAKDYGRDDKTLDIKEVLEDISKDPEYDTTHRVLSKEWDERSWETMSADPEMIKLLHIDVKNGMYDKVQPVAEKLKIYDRGRKSDLDYYLQAAGDVIGRMEQEAAYAEQQKKMAAENARKLEAQQMEKERLTTVKKKSQTREAAKSASVKRKAAAPSANALSKPDVVDYLDDSDEAFEEWYKNLENS